MVVAFIVNLLNSKPDPLMLSISLSSLVSFLLYSNLYTQNNMEFDIFYLKNIVTELDSYICFIATVNTVNILD
jgi:hypothetical protein